MEKEILAELEQIKCYSLLAAKSMLTLSEAALMTGLSKAYLYRLTCTKQIPYYKPNGRVYFNKSELEAWMQQNRMNTTAEAESKAAAYVAANPM